MHSLLRSLHNSLGLAAVGSPWLALLLASAISFLMVALISSLLFSPKSIANRRAPLRMTINFVLICFLFGSALVLVGIASLIRGTHGLTDDPLFNLYLVALVFGAWVPFGFFMWRTGYYKLIRDA